MSRPSAFIIAVSGSRTITDRDRVFDILDTEAAYYIGECGWELVWHLGDARGVDSLALEWCRERGQPRRVFYADRKGYEFAVKAASMREWSREDEQYFLGADWDVDGTHAGPIRNHAMICGLRAGDERLVGTGVATIPPADLLIAIHPDPITPGTKNAKATARNANIHCADYTIEIESTN